MIEQLASALDAAHAQGPVHRDVKPTNVLISGTTGREFVYLIDFGIAYHSTATDLLRTGSAVSALANTAPERFTTGTADARADIYALACVLYECLTGRQPFEGDSMEEQIAGHLTVEPARPSRQRSGIPTGFDDVIAAAWQRTPTRVTKEPSMAATAEGPSSGPQELARSAPVRPDVAEPGRDRPAG